MTSRLLSRLLRGLLPLILIWSLVGVTLGATCGSATASRALPGHPVNSHYQQIDTPAWMLAEVARFAPPPAAKAAGNDSDFPVASRGRSASSATPPQALLKTGSFATFRLRRACRAGPATQIRAPPHAPVFGT